MRVDFYVLPPGDKNDQLPFACRLTEKAYDLGQRIYIYTESEAQAIQLDNLLWTFRQGSFIPHALYETDNDSELPAHIGWRGEPPTRDLLINLTPTVPVFHNRFERIAEIVNHDEASKQAARERFKFYRERGITPESHTIEN